MRFKNIKMKNFMRYKGINEIEFSCDPKRNVTVILGDNTVGKTTIAQAFRWCMYGALMMERNRKENDYQILNNEILEHMDANTRAEASVDLVIEDDKKRYHIRRREEYTRDYPKLAAKTAIKSVKMWISALDGDEDEMEVEERQIEDLINELFPRNLSHYFLFDGERWSDMTVNGVRENIEESVHILTGLSSYQAAMKHLKDNGAQSVISKYKRNIKGGGKLYDDLQRDRDRMEREIAKCQKAIETVDINIAHYQKLIHEAENYLEENKNTELLQAEYKKSQVIKKEQAERVISNYRQFVQEYSGKAYMMFAQNMIKESVDMVKKVEGERRDIPHMHQSSIDYILRAGTCICGNKILPDSKELECLLEQRTYLAPAVVGTLLGQFEQTGARWTRLVRTLPENLREYATKVDDALRRYEQTCIDIMKMERRMDEKLDFAEKRRQIKECRQVVDKMSAEKGGLKGRIAEFERQIERLENEMRSHEAQDKQNEKWRNLLKIAETLYSRLKKDFEVKEQQIFQELNEQIQCNFNRMFNAKDKKLILNKKYEIQMMYQTEVGYREEKNLSEGEKIARNFAFIVTMMEYSRHKKAEQNNRSGDEVDTIPIVLDGPFSKLGDENIALIAKVLPEVSEQVILFMLDKDWKYTGLDDYVGASYHICKDSDKAYASIERGEI